MMEIGGGKEEGRAFSRKVHFAGPVYCLVVPLRVPLKVLDTL